MGSQLTQQPAEVQQQQQQLPGQDLESGSQQAIPTSTVNHASSQVETPIGGYSTPSRRSCKAKGVEYAADPSSESVLSIAARLAAGAYNWSTGKGGMAYSPRMFKCVQSVHAALSSAALKLSLSLIGLVGAPLLVYNTIPGSSLSEFFLALVNFWDGTLYMSSRDIFGVCVLASFYYANTTRSARHNRLVEESLRIANPKRSRAFRYVFYSKAMRFHRIAFCVMITHTLIQLVLGSVALSLPSWIWYPFMWGRYPVYFPSKLAPAMEGLCVDYSMDNAHNGRNPLCLSDESWNVLSTGALSSRDNFDVETVLQGITYGKKQSGGIIISVLARDVVDFVAPLRQNVESLVPFFSNVAVVIFENDSSDGSREAFKRWGQVVKGYEVDLLECDEAVDCKLGKVHRDEVGNFGQSSAIGDMHKYRQRVVDYVLGKPAYQDFSHMIVLDIDLGVSMSPLGVLHTLGTMPDNPVASVGRQPWPTSLGTYATPYDFSAFRPYATKENMRMLELQKRFCGVLPPGDRWRNECDALSPIQMIQVLAHDRMNAAFVRVESAFNGMVMYPLQLIRDSGATYDAGEDGQRCEHIGFNMGLNKPMYLNRKWDMHLNPEVPGGPNGARAQKQALSLMFKNKVQSIVVPMHVAPSIVFVWSAMTFGAVFLYPVLFQRDLSRYWQKRIKRRGRGKRHFIDPMKSV